MSYRLDVVASVMPDNPHSGAPVRGHRAGGSRDLPALRHPVQRGLVAKQSGTVVRKIVKLALPPKDRGVGSKRADERVAA
jgi:hypothetical protein